MNNRFQNKIQESAFDSFDPDNFDNDQVESDSYDPDYMDGASNGAPTSSLKTARPGVKLQINISITNNTASTINTELFSAFDSWTNRYKADKVVGVYLMIPLYTIEGMNALSAAPTGGGIVGFNQTGDCVVRGNAGAPTLTIGCGEYPYHSLFESTKTAPFYISRIRYTVSTDNQIDKQIVHFKRTFAGGIKENRISPRAFFNPNQFQNKTLDIVAPCTIDGQSGMSVEVLAGESLRFALFISQWGVPNL